MQWRGVRRLSVCLSVRPSVRPSVCKLLRKSLLLADNWPNRHQTFTRWTPDQRASRVCSRSRSISKVTWYAHFLGFLEWATPSLTVWLSNTITVTTHVTTGCYWASKQGLSKKLSKSKFSFRGKFEDQTSRTRQKARGRGEDNVAKKTASRCLEATHLPRGLHHWH